MNNQIDMRIIHKFINEPAICDTEPQSNFYSRAEFDILLALLPALKMTEECALA